VEFFSKQQFYKYKCPTPSIWERIYAHNLTETYQEQAEVFWSYQNQMQVDITIDKLLSVLTSSGSDLSQLQNFTFYSKSMFIVIINFVLAVSMVLFRFMQKSEQMKKGLPRVLSFFWLFCAL